MDFNDTTEEAAFRADARAFLTANAERRAGARPVLRQSGVDAEAVKRCKSWQRKKADAGFAGLTWPKALGGREASPILQGAAGRASFLLRRRDSGTGPPEKGCAWLWRT